MVVPVLMVQRQILDGTQRHESRTLVGLHVGSRRFISRPVKSVFTTPMRLAPIWLGTLHNLTAS